MALSFLTVLNGVARGKPFRDSASSRNLAYPTLLVPPYFLGLPDLELGVSKFSSLFGGAALLTHIWSSHWNSSRNCAQEEHNC